MCKTDICSFNKNELAFYLKKKNYTFFVIVCLLKYAADLSVLNWTQFTKLFL